MKRIEDQYEEPIVIKTEKAIIRVFRPILTDAERERRMQELHRAAADLIMEKIRLDQAKGKEQPS